MGFIEIFGLGVASFALLIINTYVAINIYISKYHLKVMDKIIYGQVYDEDNYVHKAIRTIDCIGFFIRKRNRQRLPIKTQNEILALDKKFRRPFMMLWWLYIVMMIIMIIIFILEVFFPTPEL